MSSSWEVRGLQKEIRCPLEDVTPLVLLRTVRTMVRSEGMGGSPCCIIGNKQHTVLWQLVHVVELGESLREDKKSVP